MDPSGETAAPQCACTELRRIIALQDNALREAKRVLTDAVAVATTALRLAERESAESAREFLDEAGEVPIALASDEQLVAAIQASPDASQVLKDAARIWLEVWR